MSSATEIFQKFSVLTMLLVVQGTNLAGQLGARFFFNAEDFAYIRLLESTISIFLAFALWGMPTLAIRNAAINKNEANKQIFLQSIVIPCAIIGIAFIVVPAAKYLLDWKFLKADLYLSLVLVVFSACSRISANIFLGKDGGKTAQTSLIVGFLLCAFLFLAIYDASVKEAWLPARVAAEVIIFVCLGMHIASDGKIDYDKIKSKLNLEFTNGFKLNLSLLLRVVTENLPLMLLWKFSGDRQEVATYGFGTLVLTLPMMISGLLGQSKTAIFIENYRVDTEGNKLIRKQIIRLSFGVLAIWVAGSIFSGISGLIGENEFLLFLIFGGLIFVRFFSPYFGMVYIANESYAVPIYANCLEVLIVVSAFNLYKPDTALAAGFIVTLAAFSAMLLNTFLVKRILEENQ